MGGAVKAVSGVIGGLLGGLGMDEPEPPKVVEPEPVKDVDEAARQARLDRARRAALAGGRRSTILTSPQGLPSEKTKGKKSLLGE